MESMHVGFYTLRPKFWQSAHSKGNRFIQTLRNDSLISDPQVKIRNKIKCISILKRVLDLLHCIVYQWSRYLNRGINRDDTHKFRWIDI